MNHPCPAQAARDAFAALARVGPRTRPTDAAAGALADVERAANATDVAGAAALARAAERRLEDALADPALALPQHMPWEHLAAVYAPIVAPLVAPLAYGLYEEAIRYRRLAAKRKRD